MPDRDPIADALKDFVYGLVVIGSRSSAGEPNGMTATWVCQVSFEPRMFAIAVQAGAHTRRNIEETGVFSVSALPEGSKDLSLKFTKKSASGEGRLEGEPVSYGVTGAPVLNAASAWIECEVVGKIEPGDHVIFIGKVVDGEKLKGRATTLRDTGMSYAG